FDPVEMTYGAEVGAWGRMIALLYMLWYTLFVVGNVVVLGWLGGREAGARGGARVLGGLCILVSVLTLGATLVVGYSLHAVVVAEFRMLIALCATANGLGLLGVIWAWLQWMRRDQDRRV